MGIAAIDGEWWASARQIRERPAPRTRRGAAFPRVLYFVGGDIRADSPLHQTFGASKLCS
jgi:hypothetical protein